MDQRQLDSTVHRAFGTWHECAKRVISHSTQPTFEVDSMSDEVEPNPLSTMMADLSCLT